MFKRANDVLNKPFHHDKKKVEDVKLLIFERSIESAISFVEVNKMHLSSVEYTVIKQLAQNVSYLDRDFKEVYLTVSLRSILLVLPFTFFFNLVR
jgi:uncharacterized protein (UPF0248 family)